MPRPRRPRSDSAFAAIDIYRQLDQEISWPEEVDLPPANADAARAMRIFAQVLKNRSPADWLSEPFALTLAGQLAVSTVEVQKIEQQLQREGHVIKGSTGTMIKNPLSQVARDLGQRQLALGRALQLTGAIPGKRGTLASAARNAQAAANLRHELDELDPLRLLA